VRSPQDVVVEVITVIEALQDLFQCLIGPWLFDPAVGMVEANLGEHKAHEQAAKRCQQPLGGK